MTSGPLWCVPVAAGIIAVWHNFPSELDLVGVEGGAGLLVPLERHRIFSPQFSKNFYTISSQGLQDGRRLRVILRDQAGAEIEHAADLRLAHWQIEGTPQIVSFIISRIFPKLDAQGDHETLERFLSLVSSWRASCRLSAGIGDHLLYALDVASGFFAQRQNCFVVGAGGLTRETFACFGHGESSVFITSKPCPTRAYADLGGDLVELDFSQDALAEEASWAWLQSLTPPARSSLLDRLSEVSAQVPSYVTAPFKTAVLPLAGNDSELVIKACFGASGKVFVFLEITGTARLEDIRIELFGASPNLLQAPELLTWAFPHEHNLPRVRIVAAAALEEHPVCACKVVAQIDGRSVQHWIHIQSDRTGRSLAFARDFWPLANSDERYLATVAVPLAQDWAQHAADEPAQVMGLTGRRSSRSGIDLQVVAGHRLDPLHGTLLALRSSIPHGQTVRVTLPSAPQGEEVCAKLVEWAKRYDLEGEIDVLPAHAPASAATRPASRPSTGARIALRAGFIPPGAGWIDEIAGRITQSPESVFIGVTPSRVPRRWNPNEVSTEALLDLLAHDAIVAVAASAGLTDRIVMDQPVCHTLVGRWIEWLAEAHRQGVSIVPHSSLAFWEMDAAQDDSRFGARIDEIGLSRKLAATEHREASIIPDGVINA